VAERGDVLVARRRLGFGAEGQREHFVVLQAALLTDLDTTIVAPLDDDAAMYKKDPLVVAVTAKEAGTRRPQVVLVHLLTSALLDRFEPSVAGRLTGRTMAKVDRVLQTVLGAVKLSVTSTHRDESR
jgi:mRNA-degrading endonuclease toxin of MazEF toxin-antitoxin module